jgi:hypothetical protein
MDYYEIQNASLDYTAIQLHGMSSASCGDIDAYFTHGTGGIVPQAMENIDIIRNEVAALLPAGTFTIPGDDPYCDLGG